jgi:uncharacterized membrane protein
MLWIIVGIIAAGVAIALLKSAPASGSQTGGTRPESDRVGPDAEQ